MLALEFKCIIEQEAAALLKTALLIDEQNALKAIEILVRCKGKVIVTGVGKSGIIATKIAATLTSTGTTALNLAASDALHGDLGVVSADDVVIAISNSGETEEILAILPHLKIRNTKIIAIVGHIISTLAAQADVVLDATIEKEAGHLHLAPTTSTTVALAIGDALALCVMKAKNITEHDFAYNHPAGQLGKRLTLTINDLMHKNTHTLVQNSSWNQIIKTITIGKLGAVAICDENKQLLGLITDGDVRRTIENYNAIDLENLTANEIMTHLPITAYNSDSAYHALQLMESRHSQLSILPVINKNNIFLGLIRVHDIIGKI